MNWWNELTGLVKALLVAIVVVIVGLIIFFVFIRPGQEHAKAVEAKANAAIATGKVQSGADAVNATATQGQADQATQDKVRSGNEGIDSAKGANDKVSPDVDAAGIRALCMHDIYRNTPRCRKLLGASS